MIEIRPAAGETKCTYCHDVSGDFEACPQCGALQHEDCWVELGRCGTCERTHRSAGRGASRADNRRARRVAQLQAAGVAGRRRLRAAGDQGPDTANSWFARGVHAAAVLFLIGLISGMGLLASGSHQRGGMELRKWQPPEDLSRYARGINEHSAAMVEKQAAQDRLISQSMHGYLDLEQQLRARPPSDERKRALAELTRRLVATQLVTADQRQEFVNEFLTPVDPAEPPATESVPPGAD